MTDYSEMVKINRFKLPEECSEHSGRYHQVCEEEASCRDRLNKSKDLYELILSQVDMEYRKNWNDQEWGKLTETSLKNRIINDVQIRDAKNKMFEDQRKLDIVSAAKSGMDHRKSMLNNLTSLLIGGFYSAPNGAKKENSKGQAERELRRRLNKKDSEEE